MNSKVKVAIKILSFVMLILVPIQYYYLRDKFISVLLLVVSIVLYLSVSEYVITRIQLLELKIDLEEKIEEVNITKRVFDDTISKLLVREYQALSTRGMFTSLMDERERNLPILDELRETIGNTNREELKKARNRVFEANMKATIISLIRVLERKEKEEETYSEDISEKILILQKYTETITLVEEPSYIREVVKDYLDDYRVLEIIRQYEKDYLQLEL